MPLSPARLPALQSSYQTPLCRSGGHLMWPRKLWYALHLILIMQGSLWLAKWILILGMESRPLKSGPGLCLPLVLWISPQSTELDLPIAPWTSQVLPHLGSSIFCCLQFPPLLVSTHLTFNPLCSRLQTWKLDLSLSSSKKLSPTDSAALSILNAPPNPARDTQLSYSFVR